MPDVLFTSRIDGVDGPLCEWCGGQRRPTQKATCSAICRAGRWRWLNNVTRAGGLPPDSPPWSESPLHGRMGETARSNSAPIEEAVKPGPRSGANARSGAQISYPKARRELFNRLSHFPGGERLIDEALTAALPPKQRQRMEARDGA